MSSPNQVKKEAHANLVNIICIVASYIVILGSFGIIEKLADGNAVVFIVFVVICCVFSAKFWKGTLSSQAKSLPGWFLIFLISAATGFFVAPYYIGKWIAKGIRRSALHEAIDDVIDENAKAKENQR